MSDNACRVAFMAHYNGDVEGQMVGLAACAESFGAVCMLCAESLTILPIGCIIGQKTFLQKVLCSTAAHCWHRVWGTKRNVPQFLPQFYRNFFSFGGTQSPPQRAVSYGPMRTGERC